MYCEVWTTYLHIWNVIVKDNLPPSSPEFLDFLHMKIYCKKNKKIIIKHDLKFKFLFLLLPLIHL